MADRKSYPVGGVKQLELSDLSVSFQSKPFTDSVENSRHS